ncbi:MAG: tRNA pseudouridine(38-40) synthase TruA [Candidatus Omnitrophota bacterium]|jgi:tRNA pseudouridine38-40 synthase
MRNIKLTIEYDGTNYQGWQRQKNTHRTLQEIIEKTLRKVLRQRVRLIASGRTDAAVHAQAQVANFKTNSQLPLGKLKQALNSLLPDDIVITGIKAVELGFHARFSAKSKIYRYTILNQKYPSALLRNFFYFVPDKLDCKSMRQAAGLLIGRHNFRCFQASDKKPRNSIRTIKRIGLKKQGNLIFIDIQANGFVYKMARNIVGTLIEIGKKKQSPKNIRKILTQKNRKFAGPTAPGYGLCLLRVKY